ncbi:non-homologous end joining protein Ku [Tenggerimyces flavus]|uniref:Non-homologous end joining protein Ku n=1 Tax=Tenggerimyces flavus TaxID=1708749 RepID=A0ABV7YA59_9ACTN|nr:Ku protein [Tenggerimyces flavus]MBM7785476.1 DNA end-binding protein Ku [Tenggerimyces flavus]
MAARSIWSGTLTFGLVNVPVRLYSATKQQDVSFHQFEEGTNERIRYKRVAEGSDREVEYEDIVKGYELSNGKHVMLTQDDLEAADPGRSRSIEITDFVELAEIDPIYYEKSYYLGPGPDGDKSYALLFKAMEDSELAAVAVFIMRGKQYLAVIRPADRVLILETLFFADEVRDPSDVMDDLPRIGKVSSKELKTAGSLIQQLTTPWKPEQYHDTYRESVLAIVKRKSKGEEIEVEEETSDAEVVDLMEALEQSLARAKGRKTGAKKTAKKAPAEKKTAAKKSAKKKSTRKAS